MASGPVQELSLVGGGHRHSCALSRGVMLLLVASAAAAVRCVAAAAAAVVG
eukprot:CAMPEP_0175156084 /NCGR_PEP_ID=MMETSP0087-20121206/21387_1 /TAXON_ID=136419 /ORGANISM="Unknown Unknown, Strain D1" /LENGTH=50 /DNA_ID=CAMNT_0016443417 /DNA_START=52 /DNA_END=201 /DNA_ORIENTATION=-